MSKKETKNKDLNIAKSINTSTVKSQTKAQSKSKEKAQDKRIRLSKDERKEQILMLSLQVFKQKGFLNTTMEDIVKASELSKGGVYYHYQNTIDILHDLMVLGIKYRINIINQSLKDIKNHKQDSKNTATKLTQQSNEKSLKNFDCLDQKTQDKNSKNQDKNTQSDETNTQNKFQIDFFANELYKKIITQNDFMDIYVQFLYAKKDSPKLESLFNELKEENKKEFKFVFKDADVINKNYDFLTDFINSLILGANILNSHELFLTNEILIKQMFKLILKGDLDENI